MIQNLFIVVKKVNLLVTDETVIKFFDNIGENLITYEKPKKNPHYHVLLKTDKRIDAVRNSITRFFSLGRGQKSVKICENLEKSTIYILKDGDVKNNTMYSEEELTAYQLLSEKITLERQTNTGFKTKFRQSFNLIEFNEIYETDKQERHIYIQNYIKDQFAIHEEFYDFKKLEKYYNYALMIFWPSEYRDITTNMLQQINARYSSNKGDYPI